MAESGHAKNVANFQQVINIVTALGSAYSPVQALILLAALQTVLTEAQAALSAVDTKVSAETIAVDARQASFEGVAKLGTRIYGAVGVLVNDDKFSEDVQSIVRKLRGARAGTKPVDDPSTPGVDESKAAHSVSQQSYDNVVATFAELIALVKTKSDEFKPNEDDVKIATLEAKLSAMDTANNAAKIAGIDASNARESRDAVLYDPVNGLVERAMLVKKYIAYAFGKDSAAYQQINALIFKR